MISHNIDNLAEQLRNAETHKKPISTIRNYISDANTAYAIQLANVEHGIKNGRRIIGRKIGLTSHAVQKQLGVNQPYFGTLFSDMVYGDDEPIPIERTIQPKAEAEIAIYLKNDLSMSDAIILDVINAIDYVLPAIEIVDSRIDNWNISFFDTVADNASSCLIVLGATPTKINALDLKACTMTMTRNNEIVSEGSGSACLGHPFNAAVWLARKLASLGQPLKAGDLVLTGALGPMIPIAAGDRFTANISGVGSVCAQFMN